MIKALRNRRGATSLGLRFGERVRAVRQRKAWSLEELAERAGMHVTYLSSIERGHRNPTLNVIGSLASALSLSLSELLTGVEAGGDR